MPKRTIIAVLARVRQRILRAYARPAFWYDAWPKSARFIFAFAILGLAAPMPAKAYDQLATSGKLLLAGIAGKDAVALIVASLAASGAVIILAGTGVALYMIAIEKLRIVKATPERTKTLRYLGRALRTLNLAGLMLIVLEAVLGHIITAWHL